MAEKSGRPQCARETTVCCVCRGRLTAYHDDEGDEPSIDSGNECELGRS